MIWPGRVFRLAVLLYVQTLVLVVAVELLWPRDGAPAEASAIVCLGHGFRNGMLTRSSYERAVRCAELFRAGAAPQIIFTGTGAGPVMAETAIAMGVPEAAVLVEADSHSTLQNALFTARLLQGRAEAGTRTILVSDAYHLPRSWVSFRVMGFDDIAVVPSNMRRMNPVPLLREAAAIWFNAGRYGVWLAAPWLPESRRDALLI